MNKIIVNLSVLLIAAQLSAQPNAEFRATWIVTWDLVNSYNDVSQNQALCRQILDNHLKANMNAILWQVRQSGTAYYDSDFEPWGSYAGHQYPGYDIFDYAVQNAQQRGMEIHAWFNVFHCSSREPGTPAAEHPEWVCTNQDGKFMTAYRCLSPGLSAVREYLIKVALEVVRKYDIDGLHLDFVRWNEYDEDDMPSGLMKPNDEEKLIDGLISEDRIQRINSLGSKRYIYDVEHPYNQGVPEGFATWADWRRWTVTEFVRTLHDSIQSIKPWVRLSVAALGRYRWDEQIGWDGYHTVFQDAALWFNEGYLEQLTPMHYHWLNPESFYNMLTGPTGNNGVSSCWGYWIQPGIEAGRLFSCGPASYLLKENNMWGNHVGIVEAVRKVPWADGFQFFSYSSWRDNNYWEQAKKELFPHLAKIRAAGLIDNTSPEPPTIVLTKLDTTVYRVSVFPAETGEVPSRFIVYRSKDSLLSVDKAEILKIKFGNRSFHVTDKITEREGGYYYYAATAADRFWNESPVVEVFKTDSIPEKSIIPAAVTLQYVKKVADGFSLCWHSSGKADNKGFRIYAKTLAGDWQLLLDESELDSTAREALVTPPGDEINWLFTVRAVGLGPQNLESLDPDIYGASIEEGKRTLVIDAFDRTSGQWKEATHPFAKKVCESLSRLKLAFDCGADEAFEGKKLLAENYQAIIWLCGDESTADQPLTFTELSLLANYLRKGGQLMLSGSDVGLALDYFGSTQEKKFFNEYLKTKYVANGLEGNGFLLSGEPGSLFDSHSFAFDDGASGFAVFQPDVYNPTGGSTACLKYSFTGEIAAIQYSGIIGNGTSPARIINLGFPFEAIIEEAQVDSFLFRAMSYFGFFKTTHVLQPEPALREYNLVYNYPNPFNPETTIFYSITENRAVSVSIKIFDLLGREVKTLIEKSQPAGQYQIIWQGKDELGKDVASGIYLCHVSLGKNRISRKMILIR